MAPETDLTGVSGIAIVRFESQQPSWVDGARVAEVLRAAIVDEGFIEIPVSANSQMLVPYSAEVATLSPIAAQHDANVLILGRVTPQYDVEYGQKTKYEKRTVYRSEYDIYGRVVKVPYSETVEVPVRTEIRTLSLIMDLRAVEMSTGLVLGEHQISGEKKQNWSEGDKSSSSPQADLVDEIMLDLMVEAARLFTPYREETEHLWRPRRARDEMTQRAADAAETGNYDQAAKLFKASLEVDPVERAFEWGNLAIVYDAMGEYDLALEAIKEGLRTSDLKDELKNHESELLRAYRGSVEKGPSLLNPEDLTVRIIDLTSTEVTFDGGTNRGWKVGDLIRVVRQTPVTGLEGEVLGQRETEVAQIKLILVEEKFSVGQIVKVQDGQALALGQAAVKAASVP